VVVSQLDQPFEIGAENEKRVPFMGGIHSWTIFLTYYEVLNWCPCLNTGQFVLVRIPLAGYCAPLPVEHDDPVHSNVKRACQNWRHTHHHTSMACQLRCCYRATREDRGEGGGGCNGLSNWEKRFAG
jgi:hypothetical protein